MLNGAGWEEVTQAGVRPEYRLRRVGASASCCRPGVGAKVAPSNKKQASELIDWYRARWEIELFFLILKEGCRVERLQLGDKKTGWSRRWPFTW